MRESLAYIAVLVVIGAAIPYILHTVQGKTKPNLVTWGTWTLLNAIVLVAALSEQAIQTALFTGAATVATGSILVAGIRYGYVRFSRFDIVCLISALVGIVLWVLTDNPSVAVAINVAADFAGWLPTFRHAWQEPHAETWQTFALSVLATTLTLVSISHYSFVALAYPMYFMLTDITLTTTILTRRRILL